jgi:hypothetical protein
LVVGVPDELPGGGSRTISGFSYRVVPGSGPIFPEAWLPSPREGDAALEAVLQRVVAGEELRPGEAFAPFGIRWVVFTGSNPLQVALESQFDLRQLPGLDYPTFESEVSSPRAVGADGIPWVWERPDYVASDGVGGPVYIAENQDRRWGDDWTAAGWANEVTPSERRIVFAGDVTNRNLALAAAGLLFMFGAVGIMGRDRRMR